MRAILQSGYGSVDDLTLGRIERELMGTLASLLDSGELRVVVARAYPLEQAREALHHLMSGRPLGRVVVVP